MRVLYIAFFSGVLIYLVLQLFFGSTGIIAYSKALEQAEQLRQSISDMQKIGDRMSSEARVLRGDPRRILVEARSIGYWRSNERVVLLSGYGAQSSEVSPGTIFILSERNVDYRSIFRVIAVIIAGIVFATLLIKKRRSIKKPYSEESNRGVLSNEKEQASIDLDLASD